MSYSRHIESDRAPERVGNSLGLEKPVCQADTQPSETTRASGIDVAILVYSTFAFVCCTTAFKQFGLDMPAFGLIYLGGSVLILYQTRELLARPALLFLALLFPLFALCSTAWGVDPPVTLRHAVQLTFTALIGACIGCALKPDTLMKVMAAAFVGLILVSVANLWLQVVPPFQQRDYLDGDEYFTGIFAHKNTLGLVLCLGALCLAYLACSGRHSWWFATLLVALCPLFLFARSTTSLVLYACILSMPFVYAYLRSRSARSLILLSLLSALLVIVIVLEMLSISLIDIGLELAGKGRDMSGRTSLWTIAIEQVSARPWLGVGYQSYWTSPTFSEEVGLIRGLLETSIKHFHNVWLETLVGTGIIGLLFLLTVPVVLLCRFLARTWSTGCSPVDVAGLFLVILTLARANVETSIYFQHQAENLALIALLFSTSASGQSRKQG